jgi:NADPH2:quinone reductase
MKAVVAASFGGPEVLEYTTLADPQPGPDEVLLQVHATSVNFADILARRGGKRSPKVPPFVPGLDLLGSVIEKGSGVQGLETGDRVIAFPHAGSYCEVAVARKALVFPIPDELDDSAAAGFPVAGCTAYRALTEAGRLRAGETVLVYGAAGGVGTYAIQMARVLGAATIIGVVGNAARARLVEGLGADVTLDRTQGEIASRVNELTDGKGVDVILNSVGGLTLDESFKCLAPFGRLVTFGITSGGYGTVSTELLHPSNRTLVGFSFGHIRKNRPETVASTVKSVLDLLVTGKIETVIGERFPLERAYQAHLWVENREGVGKALVDI